MPDFAQVLAGLNSPHPIVLFCALLGCTVPKNSMTLSQPLLKCWLGSAEPFCLLLVARVEPKAFSMFQKIFSSLQDVALMHCMCIIIKEDEICYQAMGTKSSL